MEYRADRKYAETHEWVMVEGDGIVVVGISDFAQDQLGDIVYVDLPEAGGSVESGDTLAEVESTKSVGEVYAPVAGTIAAVNESLLETPELVNRDPYGDGWLLRIQPAAEPDLEGLMEAAAYQALVE